MSQLIVVLMLFAGVAFAEHNTQDRPQANYNYVPKIGIKVSKNGKLITASYIDEKKTAELLAGTSLHSVVAERFVQDMTKFQETIRKGDVPYFLSSRVYEINKIAPDPTVLALFGDAYYSPNWGGLVAKLISMHEGFQLRFSIHGDTKFPMYSLDVIDSEGKTLKAFEPIAIGSIEPIEALRTVITEALESSIPKKEMQAAKRKVAELKVKAKEEYQKEERKSFSRILQDLNQR